MPLTITDKPALDALFASKTPRPIREIMLEIYPEAVEDSNGRFHAPHDGYIDPIYNREYRGGEYLPQEEDEENTRIYGNAKKLPRGVDLDGNHHVWDGTFAQRCAVWGELIRQSKAHQATISKHLGAVGDKLTLELTIDHIHFYMGYYANVFIHIMHDQAGNVVIYKKSGGKLSKGRGSMGRPADVEKGDTITLVAKVKKHDERDGVKQTVIERPKVQLLP